MRWLNINKALTANTYTYTPYSARHDKGGGYRELVVGMKIVSEITMRCTWHEIPEDPELLLEREVEQALSMRTRWMNP